MPQKIGVFRRMMMEIPHVPLSLAHFAFGIAAGSYYLMFVHKEGIGYQAQYTVMRSDDPRVKKFKNFDKPLV